MKRCIFIEVSLLLTVGILIALCVSEWSIVSDYNDSLNTILKYGSDNMQDFVDLYNQQITKHTIYAVLAITACALNITAMVLIAIKDFPIFKPLLDKANARREQRAQAKTEKAEADKQAKIAALEAQLEELKKD